MAEENKEELNEKQLDEVSGGINNTNDMTPEERKRDFWFKGGIE